MSVFLVPCRPSLLWCDVISFYSLPLQISGIHQTAQRRTGSTKTYITPLRYSTVDSCYHSCTGYRGSPDDNVVLRDRARQDRLQHQEFLFPHFWCLLSAKWVTSDLKYFMRFESPYIENVPSISGEWIRMYSTGQMTLPGKYWSIQRNCVSLSFPLPKIPNALIKIWVSSYGLGYPAVSNVVIIIWVSSYGLGYPAVSNVVIVISIFQLCLLLFRRQGQKAWSRMSTATYKTTIRILNITNSSKSLSQESTT
jgi:hypothetical protein